MSARRATFAGAMIAAAMASMAGCGGDAGPPGTRASLDRDGGPESASAKIDPGIVRSVLSGEARDVVVVLIEPAPAPDAPSNDDDEPLADDVSAAQARRRLDTEVSAREEAHARLSRAVGADVVGAGLDHWTPYRHIPVVKARVRSSEALAALAGDARVAAVYADEPLRHALTESLALVHQPIAIADGKGGAGTAVAVLDTGVDYGRSAFGSCVAPGAAGCKVAFATDFAADDGARDDNGHGTNVAAITLGVAPATRILALDVFDGGLAYTSVILRAIDWVIQQRDAFGIVAMNMSFGGGLYASHCDTGALGVAIAAARAAGVLSAVAAGNGASPNALSSPACASSAVSVGAVYDAAFGPVTYSGCSDAAPRADAVTCFSNSAPFLTMLAPGAFITAAGATYAGTSQATPHVAGAIAVLAATYPGSTPAQTLSRIVRAGTPVTDPRNGVTKPRLDVAAASCSAIVAPSSRTVSSAGGDLTLSVATGPTCPWATSSKSDWLAIESGMRGPGNVVVRVAPNSGPQRSGYLSVARRKITVTQRAAP